MTATDTESMPTIYLAGAIPEGEAADNAEEATISLARAAYARGAQLIVNAEPTVASLVSLVAGEYAELEPEEEEERGPEDREARRPPGPRRAAVIVLQRGAGGEERDIDSILQQFGYTLPAQNLQAVFARTVGMVCIGRQDERDQSLFREFSGGRAPIIALPSTGAQGPLDFEAEFERLDDQFRGWLAGLRERAPEEESEPELPGTSYPVMMQVLVSRLLG